MDRQDEFRQKVFTVADRLKKGGSKISARTILAETGGSMGDVAQCYRQWRQIQAANLDFQFSERLKNAIREEISRSIEAAKGQLETDLHEALSREHELIESLSLAEKTIQTQKEELANTLERETRARQDAERNEAVLINQIENLRTIVFSLEKEKDEVLKKIEAARNESIKCQALRERAEKEVEKFESRLLEVQTLLDSSFQERNEAVKNSAVAEARAEELKSRVAYLQGSIKNMK